ncbi:MAG: polyphosphate polymerase domain-containing protein [Erysipelotrichaceae bacterium]|nr:polyphosphate polymerase domain-containing protein [Erysipelotrichaceae bacterium]
MKYRNEWKYYCSNAKMSAIDAKLKRVLKLDPHSVDGMYAINSLYFDDFKNSCARDNEAGEYKRSKWRIRFYGNDLNYIVLEKKIKLFGMCGKKSCTISRGTAEKIIKGDVSEVFWNSESKLLKLFCIDIMTNGYRPKTIVSYERRAYLEPISNVRITLDRNISGSNETDKFLDNDYLRVPLLEKDMHILEVKFDDILPAYIQQASYIRGLQQTSFSKYYLCRKSVEGK